MSNNVKYCVRYIPYAVILLFTSEGIVQTFFAEIGFTTRQIGTYISLLSVVQIVVMAMGVFLSDRIKRVKDALAVMFLTPSLFCLAMLPACFSENENLQLIYGIALVFGGIQSLFMGFASLLSYRLPYETIDMDEYARLENYGGIARGITSIAVGGIITFLATVFPYKKIMTVGFGGSAVLCVWLWYLIKSMKIRNVQEYTREAKFSFAKLIKREFVYFYVPSFLKGIAMGLISVMSVVCIKEISSEASVLSGLTTILSVAAIAGSVLYQAVRKRLQTSALYMYSSIVMCLFLPLMLVGRTTAVFYVCYFIVCIGYSIVSLGASVHAAETISYQDIGTFTSVRMVVMTLGQAIASYGVAVAMDYVPTAVILTICGLAQLGSGVLYYLYDIKVKNKVQSTD